MKRFLIVALIAFLPFAAGQSYNSTELCFQAHHAPDFGYAYAEDVRDPSSSPFHAGEVGSAFVFTGHPGDFAYAGTEICPTEAVKLHLNLEANTEGATSGFAVFFSTAPGALDKGSGQAAGRTGGDFSDGVKFKLTEDREQWSVGIYENTNGVETQLGGTFTVPGGDDAASYRFIVDTEAQVAQLRNDADQVITERTLSGVAGQTMTKHWLVGYGLGTADETHPAYTTVYYHGHSTRVYDVDDEPPQWTDVEPGHADGLPAMQATSIQGNASDTWTDTRDLVVIGQYRVTGGPIQDVSTVGQGERFRATFPGQVEGARLEAWLHATDEDGNTATTCHYTWIVGGGPVTASQCGPLTPVGTGDDDSEGPGWALGFIAAALLALSALAWYLFHASHPVAANVGLLVGVVAAAFIAYLAFVPAAAASIASNLFPGLYVVILIIVVLGAGLWIWRS